MVASPGGLCFPGLSRLGKQRPASHGYFENPALDVPQSLVGECRGVYGLPSAVGSRIEPVLGELSCSGALDIGLIANGSADFAIAGVMGWIRMRPHTAQGTARW